MKVGDKFKDGNRTFEVLQVLGNGMYISKCIACEPNDMYKSVETIPTKVIDDNPETDEFGKSYTKTEINRMPKDKLEILSQELGLEVGTTAEMKTRLLAKLGL